MRKGRSEWTHHCLVVLSVLCVRVGQAHGLPDEPSDRSVLTTWGPEDGVPQGEIWSIQQTPDGFLWLGTSAGVARFDGVSFRTFRRPDGMGHSHVGQDELGRLWVGGDVPQLLIDGRFVSPPAPGFRVDVFHRDLQGRSWLAGPGGMVRLAQPVRGEPDSYDLRVPIDERMRLPHDMVSDPGGALWLATERGLWRFQSDDWTNVANVREPLFSIARRQDGTLWLGGKDGVLRVDPESGRTVRFGKEDGLPAEDRVYVVHADRDDSLWVGTRRGLARFRGDHFEHVHLAPGGLGDRVWGMGEDRDGNLWIGSTGHLTRIRRAPLQLVRLDGDGANRPVLSAVAAGPDGVWAGDLDGNLWSIQRGGAVSPVSLPTSGLDDGRSGILSLLRDRGGGLWIGYDKGRSHPACHWTPTATTCLGPDDGFQEQELVRTFFEDSQGRVWIAGGILYRFEEGKVTRVQGPGGDVDNVPTRVVAIEEDRDGVLWMATQNAVWHLDGEGWHERKLVLGGASLRPQCMRLAQDGSLWLGTTQGLVHLRDDQLHDFGSASGIMDASVLGILEEDGTFWLVTVSGLVRVRLSALRDFEDGRQSAIPIAHYGPIDGLGSRELIGPYSPVAVMDDNRRLWVATFGGVNVMDTGQDVPLATGTPTTLIEEIWIEAEPVTRTANAQKPRARGAFTATFTAAALTAPGHMRFRYRLYPYDSQWIVAGGDRRANYTNLPAGHYTFAVSAQYGDGPWSDKEATFDFALTPPFWDSPVFKGILGALVLLLILGGYRWRMRRLHERHQLIVEERTRIARELHDTVAQGFSAIALQLEVAMRKAGPNADGGAGHVQRAHDIARSSSAEARSAIWALRHQALARGDLPGALAHVAGEFSESLQVAFTVKGNPGKISKPAEQALLRVSQEALTNVTRHADTREARVELAYSGDLVVLTVTDAGKGFDSTKPAPDAHYGVIGMRERLSAVGGELHVESTPGRGTRVEARVPLRDAHNDENHPAG